MAEFHNPNQINSGRTQINYNYRKIEPIDSGGYGGVKDEDDNIDQIIAIVLDELKKDGIFDNVIIDEDKIANNVVQYLIDNDLLEVDINAIISDVKDQIKNDTTFIVSLKGDKGDPGVDGKDGISPSASDVATELKSDTAFVASIKGEPGANGIDGQPGPKGDPGQDGNDGQDGAPGPKGDPGADGKDADPQDVANLLKADIDFLASVKGDKGDKGDPGVDGQNGLKGDKGDLGPKGDKGDPGADGKDGVSPTAESISEELKKDADFVAALKGDPGKDADVDLDQLATDIKTDANFVAACKGDKGDKGDTGKTAYDLWKEAGNAGSEEDMFNSFHGRSGADGRGIANITKKDTDYLTDHYEITYTDGTTDNFDVVNGANGRDGATGATGNGIALLEQNVTSTQDGGTNNIKCVMDDGTEKNFSIKNGSKGNDGNGIATITKDSSAGKVDTYKIIYTDGSYTTFTVTNATDVSNLSQLNNDAGFVTDTVDNLVNYYTKNDIYTKTEIQNQLKTFSNGLSSKIVDALPTDPADINSTTIYLVKATDGSNSYEQFMYIDGQFASLGTTTIDLSGFYSKSEIDAIVTTLVTRNVLDTLLANYVKKNELGRAAFSNSYNDLDDLPTIGSGSADIDDSVSSLTTTYSSSKIEKEFGKKTDVDNKVDKEDGKGLSSNDFTTALLLKLNGIADKANNYTLPEATTTILGGVIIDGTSLKKDANGVLHAIGGGSGGVSSYSLLDDKPTINGNVVNQSNTTDSLDLLSKSTYGSPSRNDAVAKADVAKIIEGFDSGFSPMQYYGTDNNNVLGVHNLPMGSTVTPEIEQAIFMGVTTGDMLHIPLAKQIVNNKFMIDFYKEIIGEKGLEKVLCEFNRAQYYNYCFDPEMILFSDDESETGVSIVTLHEKSFIENIDIALWQYNIENIDKIENLELLSDFDHYAHKLSKGNRNSLITVTYRGNGSGVTSGTSATAWQFIVDGAHANANAYTTGTNNSNFILDFDFKVPVCMKGLYYLQHVYASHGLFNMYGSDDGQDWKFLDTFTWHGTTSAAYKETIKNDCSFRYYRMQGAGKHNLSGAPWHWEMYFDICPADFLLMDGNGNFYSVYPEYYDSTSGVFTPLTESVAGESADVQKIVFDQYGFVCGDLLKEITINGETFRPIDKIDDTYSLVSMSDRRIGVVGLINNDELIVMNNATSFKTAAAINSLVADFEETEDTGYIKCAFSIDNGVSWKSFDGTDIVPMTSTCPRNKAYGDFTETEKQNWDSFKNEIITKGFPISNMSVIDFNTIESGDIIESILFAFVLHNDSIEDVCKLKSVTANIDEKSYACSCDPGDITVKVVEGSIDITPNIDITKLYVNTFL